MNPNQMFQALQQMRSNPAQLMSRMNIPQNLQNDPQGAIQHLMNNGTITQQQFNQAQNMANQMRSNPMFARLFK